MDQDRAALRAALCARADGCWERLADAASELHTLHEIPEDVILARVRQVIADERSGRGLDVLRTG